jgi:hypothetical protein
MITELHRVLHVDRQLVAACSLWKEYITILIAKFMGFRLTCLNHRSLLCQISSSFVDVVCRHTIMDFTEHLDRITHRHANLKYVRVILYGYFSMSVML